MADPSFDVVSKVDRQEVDNALNQAAKELSTRFDFRGTNTTVAWAGEEAVADVEVSTDDGRTWRPADLIGMRARYSWTLWEYLWEVAEPGVYNLLSRATSAGGRRMTVLRGPVGAPARAAPGLRRSSARMSGTTRVANRRQNATKFAIATWNGRRPAAIAA